MTVQKHTEAELNIQASADKVWAALTQSEWTRQYMYGCNVESTWEIGAPVLWVGAADGITYVQGNLLEWKENEKLVYTVIAPNADYPLSPENHLEVEFFLLSNEIGTKIHVQQGDFTQVADGAQRWQDVVGNGGWLPVLETIKKLIEAG